MLESNEVPQFAITWSSLTREGEPKHTYGNGACNGACKDGGGGNDGEAFSGGGGSNGDDDRTFFFGTNDDGENGSSGGDGSDGYGEWRNNLYS